MTDLSENKSCNVIFMIINKLTKMRHYIIYKVNKEKTSVKQII